jgi:predicted  nucleic acid-binding Zn-ribbon protein
MKEKGDQMSNSDEWTTLEKVLARLEGVKQAGDGFDAAMTFAPLDLDGEPLPPPNIMAVHDHAGEVSGHLFSPGQRVVLHGPPGCGKSMFAMALAEEVTNDGGVVLWADPDGNGEQRLRTRAKDVFGFSKPQAALFRWARADEVAAPAAFAERMREVAEAHQPRLVVWDSLAKAITTAQLDDNAAADVNVWMDAVVESVRKVCPDAIHLLIDHAPKADLGSGMAIGSQRKIGAADCALRMWAPPDAAAGQLGTFYIGAAKDRDAAWHEWAGEGLTLSLTGDRPGYYLQHRATGEQRDEASHESRLIAGAAALRELTRDGTGVSRQRWKDSLRGAYKSKDRVIAELIEAGVAVEGEPYYAKPTWVWAKPYEKEEA